MINVILEICQIVLNVKIFLFSKILGAKKSYNSSIRDSLNSYNQNTDSNLCENDSSGSANQNYNQETFGNRNKNHPSYVNQVQINLTSTIQKKNGKDKKITNNLFISPGSDKKIVNNYFSEKSECNKKIQCPCFFKYDESLIKNNQCRLCGRFIEFQNNNKNIQQNNQIIYLENIIKKKNNDSENLPFNPKPRYF